MKHRSRFTTAEDLAAYDKGYQLGLSEKQVDLPESYTREAVAADLITLIGVLDGLQEKHTEHRRKQRRGE